MDFGKRSLEGLMGRAAFRAGCGVLGTCHHLKEAHKATTSAWAATATTGLAESLGWCSPALGLAVTERGEHLSGFINPCGLGPVSRGLTEGIGNQGVIHSSCSFGEEEAPLAQPCPRSLPSPWGRISSIPCSVPGGTFQVTFCGG